VALDPGLVRLIEEAHGADGRGGDELDGEDGVDLADELVSDVDGSLCDGAAKLNSDGSLANKSVLPHMIWPPALLMPE
jgi:hypothetical protein